jgi:hypothetical protein
MEVATKLPALKMTAECSSKTVIIIYKIIQRHNPEDYNTNLHPE